jgi:hypothetical protein
MRVQKRNPWLTGLGVVLAVIALAALSGRRAGALVADDQAGTIAIFPKVIADGTRDTIITLTNTSNMQAYVHCEYVQGAGICETSPLVAPVFCTRDIPTSPERSTECTAVPGERCLVRWQSQNFDLILTRQQPTMWRVSTGRVFDLLYNSKSCELRLISGVFREVCPGFFFTNIADPLNPTGNLLPPPGSPFFRGELKCFQTDQTLSAIMAGDALKGEAILETINPAASPRISEYNSINIQGEEGTSDLVLKLNHTPTGGMGVGEFDACPEAIEFTHFGNGANNIIASALSPTACDTTGCPVRTEITVIPCTENFESEQGSRVPLFFEFFDEFETPLNSSSPILDCWATYDLSSLTTTQASTGGSTFWKTRITPQGVGRCRSGANSGLSCSTDAQCGPGGVCGPVSSILAVVEEFYDTDATLGIQAPGSAATNTTMINNDSDPDAVRSGRCRGALATRCQADSGCGTGLCRIASTSACEVDGDCTADNADCADVDDPLPCCTGAGTGTCANSPDDFCDRCMFDEIIFNKLP